MIGGWKYQGYKIKGTCITIAAICNCKDYHFMRYLIDNIAQVEALFGTFAVCTVIRARQRHDHSATRHVRMRLHILLRNSKHQLCYYKCT